MSKLKFIDKLMRTIGFRYVINKNTMEIHDLKNVQTNCKLTVMSNKNKSYCNKSKKEELMRDTLHDGCRWCLPSENNG